MKLIDTKDAVGHVLCHDITRILPGVEKGPVFKKGHIVTEEDIPVLCFGLRTDFQTHFFPGSRRLMELADSIAEIKTICACGSKATVNARIDANGRIITAGEQVLLGGNDSYIAMCHRCWARKIRAQQAGGTEEVSS